MMVKAIIFDFWGTLVENGVRSPIKQVQRILNLQIPFSEYVIRMERAMMTREFAGLKEAFQAVCAEFNIYPPEEVLEELVGIWNKSWMLAEPYPELAEVLAGLKEEYTLVLVSNTDNFSVNRVMEKYKLDKFFNKIFFSYDLGSIKTDPGFLKHVVSELGLQIEDCVMIGDSIHSDMIAAKKVGMKSVLVDRRELRDFTPKIKDLTKLEKVL